MARLTTKWISDRPVLERLANCRLGEARKLPEAKSYSGAIYLGGYAVECWLKISICKSLDVDKLPGTFMTHDLEGLLLHAGLLRRLQNVPEVHGSLAKIRAAWTMEGAGALRYRDPRTIKKSDARKFLIWVAGRKVGVVPWL